MLVKLITACGCYKFMDIPKDWLHREVDLPLIEPINLKEISLNPEFKKRTFVYTGYAFDPLLGTSVPHLTERL